MATISKRAGSPAPSWRQRIMNYWRTLFAPGDLTALVACVALLIVPALALDATGWNLSIRIMIPVSALSVLFGFLLARSQYNEFFSLLLGALYGFGTVLLVAALNQPGSFAQGLSSIFERFAQWVTDIFSGGVNPDDLVFTLLVASLFWFLGYNISWHVFRIDRVWRAVLPPGLILVANNIYYQGEANVNIYLLAFVFLSLLLLVRSHLEAREWDWYVNGIRVPKRLRREFLRVGGVLALLTLIFAWLIPTGDLQERLNSFQQFLQQDSMRELAEMWSRLFVTGDLQGPATTDYYGGDSLQLGGAIRLGDQTVMLVSAPHNRRYYWRSRVFDNYENGTWTSAATTRLTDPEAPLDIINEPFIEGARVPVQQTFTVGLSVSRLIYTAPQPQRVDLATRTDLRYGQAGDLKDTMNISVIRPYHVLYRGDSYTVVSMMNNANADQLRTAPNTYPDEIATYYLNVPSGTTARTMALADQIVADANATTPYDMARAVEKWLRQNITYNEVIPSPPTGQDSVDWVLFDLRQGYCNYYASAMVMMLRHLGVPARMVAGFAQGEWDATEQAFVVRERDAHTWVEVYFPGYGWVEFEPTSAQAEINRGDADYVEQQPTPTQVLPSPTPTSTPTPTPTSTPTPGAPEETPQQQMQLTATSEPTNAPTPTPTPVIVPTLPPPLRPQPRDPLGFIVSAIGAALLGLLLLAIIAAVLLFIYWYWEWRGMRGMNPIVRAYARIERYLSLIGINLGPEETPEERRNRIVRDLPAIEPPINAITRLYVTEKYAPPIAEELQDSRNDVANHAWQEVRGNIVRRWLRRLWPWGKR